MAQATNLEVCKIDDDLVAKLKRFRFRKDKNNAAIVSEYTCCYILKVTVTTKFACYFHSED